MLNIELDFLTWNLTLVLHSIFVIEKKEKKKSTIKKVYYLKYTWK